MEFLYQSSSNDGPLVAFGGSDGVIRVLSMITWKVLESFSELLLFLPFFGILRSIITEDGIMCRWLEDTLEVIKAQ
jgi:hypothetical protein